MKLLNIINILNIIYKYLFIYNILGENMASLTLAIPKELKEEMEKHKEINWSEIARQAIMQKLALLAKMDELLKKSKLTESETIKLGRKVNKKIAERLNAER